MFWVSLESLLFGAVSLHHLPAHASLDGLAAAAAAVLAVDLLPARIKGNEAGAAPIQSSLLHQIVTAQQLDTIQVNSLAVVTRSLTLITTCSSSAFYRTELPRYPRRKCTTVRRAVL